MSVRRVASVVAMSFLAAGLVVGCGGDESAEPPPKPAETKPAIENPVPEAEARKFLDDLISAMNARDNLQLIRLISDDGKFAIQSQGGSVKPLDSVQFLQLFQAGIGSFSTYFAEVSDVSYQPKPKGAALTAMLHEEARYNAADYSSDEKILFTLVRAEDGSVVCTGMTNVK